MQCYLCGKNDLEVIRTKLRHNIKRDVMRCKNCSLVFLAPKENSDSQEFYGEEYRKLYSPVVGKELNSKEIFDIYLPYQEARVNRIKNIIKPEMRVLDIGCSAGHFLYAISKHVSECIGLEYNKDNAAFVESELGFKVYQTPIEETDLPLEHFDLITGFQMFEHVEDPLSFLKNVSKYLKKDGYLCLEVPNIDEALFTIYDSEEYANFIFKEPHVFYYSPKTLREMVVRAGFSGHSRTIQRINFLNHIHWIMTREPQKGADIHMALPGLTKDIDSPIKKELYEWAQKANKDYAEILNKYNYGESILFVGKKIK